MTDQLTAEGAAALKSYLDEVRRSLRNTNVDASEVCADIRDHVRESVGSDRADLVDADEIRAILDRLGAPSHWDSAARLRRSESAEPASAARGLDLPAVGVFALATAGFFVFPWIGPSGLVLSWAIGRGLLASRQSEGRCSNAGLLWIRVPVALVAVGFVGLFLLGPLDPLFELGGKAAARPVQWAVVTGGIGLWWTVVGLVLLRFAEAVRLLLYPLPVRRRYGRTLALVGAIVLTMSAVLVVVRVGIAEAEELSDDPTGRYEYTTEMNGRPMDGSMELRGDASGGLVGELRLGALPPARVTGGSWVPPVLDLDIQLPEGAGTLHISMAADASFTGEIVLGAHHLDIAGRKTRAGPPLAVLDFLAAIRPRLDELIPRGLEENREAGLAVTVYDRGQVWTRGYGLASREDSVRVTDRTLFQVGSVSKLVSAWGVLRLVESGHIALDSPADSYLKRWHMSAGAYEVSAVTVRRLLSHTAGINVSSISGVDLGKEIPDLVTELNGRGRGPDWQVRITADPGREFRYSGGGYLVLQLLVEDLTGRPFADYMRTEVLVPLGMTDSSYEWDASVAGRVATPYSRDPQRDQRHRLFAGVAGAGLYSSARDLAVLIAAHFPGRDGQPPGRGVIKPATLSSMVTPDDSAVVYGLGYEISRSSDGDALVGHSGSNVGWKANLLLAPNKGIGIAVLTNDDVGRTRAQVVDLARELMSRVPVAGEKGFGVPAEH